MDDETKERVRKIYESAKTRKLDDMGATKEVFADMKNTGVDLKEVLRYLVQLRNERFVPFTNGPQKREPYDLKDKRHGCQLDENGYAVDYFTQEEIPEDLYISYLDNKGMKFCFNIENLYQYYKTTNKRINPANNQELPQDMVDEMEQFGRDNSVYIDIDGALQITMEFYNNIGELIIEVLRNAGGNNILSNVTNYDVFGESYSLYSFDLEDPMNISFNRKIFCNYEEFGNFEDKDTKLIKMFEFAKKRKDDGKLYESIYSHLGMYLSAVPYIAVDGGIDYKVEPNDTVIDVLLGIYNALGGISQNIRKWNIVFETGKPLYEFKFDDKVMAIAPAQEIYWVPFVDDTDIEKLTEKLKGYAFINNDVHLMQELYGNETRKILAEEIQRGHTDSVEEIIDNENYTLEEFIEGIKQMVHTKNIELLNYIKNSRRLSMVKKIDRELLSPLSSKLFNIATGYQNKEIFKVIYSIIQNIDDKHTRIDSFLLKNSDLFKLKKENEFAYNFIVHKVLPNYASMLNRILEGKKTMYNEDTRYIISETDNVEIFEEYLPEMDQKDILFIINKQEFPGIGNILQYVIYNLYEMPFDQMGVAVTLNYKKDKTDLINYLNDLDDEDYNKLLISDFIYGVSDPSLFDKILSDPRVEPNTIDELSGIIKYLNSSARPIMAMKSNIYNEYIGSMMKTRSGFSFELFKKFIPQMRKYNVVGILKFFTKEGIDRNINWFFSSEYAKDLTERDMLVINLYNKKFIKKFLMGYSSDDFNRILKEIIDKQFYITDPAIMYFLEDPRLSVDNFERLLDNLGSFSFVDYLGSEKLALLIENIIGLDEPQKYLNYAFRSDILKHYFRKAIGKLSNESFGKLLEVSADNKKFTQVISRSPRFVRRENFPLLKKIHKSVNNSNIFELIMTKFKKNIDIYLYFDPEFSLNPFWEKQFDENYEKYLNLSCKVGAINTVKYILATYTNLIIPDICYILSVKYNNLDILKLLLSHKTINKDMILFLEHLYDYYEYSGILEI